MQYKFKESEEEKDKPAIEKTIEKRGHVIEFSMVEMEHDIVTFEKTLKELKGNRDLKDGILKNMDAHHPFIKDMSEFDRYAVHMYQEAWASRKAFDDKIAQIEKEYEDHMAEIAFIKEQLPDLKGVVSPYAEGAEVPGEQIHPDHIPEGEEEVDQKNDQENTENK